MRAFDVGVGLAVSWARQRGVGVSSSARVTVWFDGEFPLLADSIRMDHETFVRTLHRAHDYATVDFDPQWWSRWRAS
jgi:hypothetical protein